MLKQMVYIHIIKSMLYRANKTIEDNVQKITTRPKFVNKRHRAVDKDFS
jgi:hypothetical protein